MADVPFSVATPTIGSTPWGAQNNAALSALGSRVATHEAAYGVSLDAFSGPSDDAKFSAALTYATQQTYKPTIVMPNRLITFNQKQTMFNGFSISGPPGTGSEFRYNQKIKVSVPGSGWLDQPAGTVKGIYIGNLSFEGDSNTSFFVDYDNTGPVLWASLLENLGFNLFKHVIWGAHNAVTFAGYWDVNNGYDTQFKLWGSDGNYWTDGMLIDSPNYPTGNVYHIYLVNVTKTAVGPVFITGKSNICPMRIDGGRGIVVTGARMEAQQGNPTWGSQLLVTGGKFIRVRDCWYFNGMSQPNTTGHANAAYDKGIITITGGSNILIEGCMFSTGDGSQTSATPAGTPHVYIGGGTSIRVRNLQSSDAPNVVRNTAVSAATIVTDSDVTVTVG
ncbi:MAG: hypothetical protein JWN52_5721 [Actinomycetia bacterium]|nr:hypothetical protein [Actinomycetes bacterium]